MSSAMTDPAPLTSPSKPPHGRPAGGDGEGKATQPTTALSSEDDDGPEWNLHSPADMRKGKTIRDEGMKRQACQVRLRSVARDAAMTNGCRKGTKKANRLRELKADSTAYGAHQMKVRSVPRGRARQRPQLPRPTTRLAREKFDAGKKQSSHDASSHYKKGRQAEHVTRPLHPLEDQVTERA
jgi:hypothetical protein